MEQVNISPEIVEAATQLLEENGVIHEVQDVYLEDRTQPRVAVISPNQEDLVPLHSITFEGRTYYLGLPR